MAMRDRAKEKASSFLGQKSGLPIESYGIDAGALIQNFVLKDQALKKINGGEVYAVILPEEVGGITSLHRFKNLWIAQRGLSIAAEDVEGGTDFTTIQDDLPNTNKFFSSSWRDRIFLVNKTVAKFLLNRANSILDVDRKYGNLGLESPSYAEITTTTDDGGDIASGTYFYLLTVYDAATNSESPAWGSVMDVDGFYELSPNVDNNVFGPTPLEVTVVGEDKVVEFDSTDMSNYLQAELLANPRITHFSLYRAEPIPGAITAPFYNTFLRVPLKNGGTQDGNTIINIQEFLSTGSVFVDSTESSQLSVALPTNNSPPPTIARFEKTHNRLVDLGYITESFNEANYSGYRHIRVFRDQLFGIGAFSQGLPLDESVDLPQFFERGMNAFSSILHGSEVYQPDYLTYLWEVGRGDGQIAVGLGVMGDTALLIFKERSTYYLSGSSPENFVVRIMDTVNGCVNQSTIQETPVGVIVLNRSGFVLFNKVGQGTKISNDIKDVIDSIRFQYADLFYSWYDVQENRYYCSVVVTGAAIPNLTCALDLDSMQWTVQRGTEGLSRLTDSNSDQEFIDLLGSAANNGRLVNFSNPNVVTNQGSTIEAIWTSGTLTFGDDQRHKQIQWLYIRAQSQSNWEIDIEIIPDYDESRKYIIENWNVERALSTWYSSDDAMDGSLIWDEGVWASEGPVMQVSKIPVIALGFTFQIRIIERNTDPDKAGFVIQSVSAEAVMMGK